MVSNHCRRQMLRASIALAIALGASATVAASEPPTIADGISGVVASSTGPEAGVWVIAETRDLGVGFVKTVVTDDRGRFVLPELPKANYKVWVRGYGLVDSKPLTAVPGTKLDLTAVIAPDARSAAEHYPANYWYALARPPAANQFPGGGEGGNGIAPSIKTQGQWITNMKDCVQCHQMGSRATRTAALPTPEFWEARVTQVRPDGDPSMVHNAKGYTRGMLGAWKYFGSGAQASMFADWSKRIAAGELPKEIPPRPAGVERNVVLTQWEWGIDGSYYHDSVSSDRRHPNVNANGPVYGILTNKSKLGILDPVKHHFRTVDLPGGEYDYIHTLMMDRKGRVWLPSLGPIYSGAPWQERPAFCTDGKLSKYAKHYPAKGVGATAVYVYDPATDKVERIPTCLSGAHVWFGHDKNDTLYFTSEVVGWFDTKVWDQTHDPAKAQGWCPMVINTGSGGTGKIDPDRGRWKMLGEPADAPKDTLITEYAYGLSVNPVDDSVWFGLKDYPGAITRMERGSNPPLTCKTEYYQAPKLPNGEYVGSSPHDLGFDSNGIAYVAFTSGHIGQFDRSKCKQPSGSPGELGQSCPEGWKIFDVPGPRFEGAVAGQGNADYPYQTFVDRFGTLGLGNNLPMFPGSNSDSLLVLDPGASQWVTLRVPYPQGFYSRWLDGRIDNASAGWKGRGLWATYSTVPVWHQEGVTSAQGQLVKFQMRGNPLEH